jgi:hypothetical protein
MVPAGPAPEGWRECTLSDESMSKTAQARRQRVRVINQREKDPLDEGVRYSYYENANLRST